MTRILLIEDNEKHLEDAKNLLENRIKVGAISKADFVVNLDEAMSRLETTRYEGIISDVFFPKKECGFEEANGVLIGEYALKKEIPFVFITSTFHHAEKTSHVYNWATKNSIVFVDALVNPRFQNEEAGEKYWKGAYLAISYLITLKDEITPTKHNIENSHIHLKRLVDALNPTSGMLDEYRESGIQKCNLNLPYIKKSIETYCKGIKF